MPNSLVHFGVNGFLSKSLIKETDLVLIYFGAIIPDVPWILQRFVGLVYPAINLYDLRLYCVILSSFLFCLIFSAAISQLFKNWKPAFIIFSLGSFLHLVTDSVETKWANGAQFFVPFNWDLYNAGLIWPENEIIYVFTFLGLLFIFVNWRTAIKPEFILVRNLSKIVISIVILIIYFTLPIFFVESAEKADNHYVKTLRNYEKRPGKYFEIDRGNFIHNKYANIYLTSFDEKLKVKNLKLSTDEIMSIRARFITHDEIDIIDYHIHSNRDIISYIGLFLLFILTAFLLFKSTIKMEKNSRR